MTTDVARKHIEEFSIQSRLRGILASNYQIDQRSITLETEPVDLGIDSLSLVELANSIENEFGVIVDDKSIEGLKKVGDLLTHISTSVTAETTGDH